MSKRYRVSQYSTRYGTVIHKSYRFKWFAKVIAFLYRGDSAFGGFDFYETYISEV